MDSTLARRMTMEKELSPPKRLVPMLIPWVVAAAALALYLTTLNRWVSLGSLASVARVSGWTWQPELSGPLYWLLTYPFRWLPARSIPLALNLFSALCAALTLALLARSVALLPHDRTEEQRIRQRGGGALLSTRSAWLPPVLAALVCGLQLTFWEDATAGSADMLDLLVLAYVIRCVLEFRLTQRQSWLSRAAFVYGLGMTSDWAMIAFLPVFLVALVWLKGLGFFNARFLVRMSLWGLAGLTLYLLLPLVQNAASVSHVPFWQGLQANLRFQKFHLFARQFGPFNKQALFQADQPLWVLGMFSLLPLLVMSISWPSYFGDPSRLGVALATLIFHFFHALLLVVCIWVALDPQFSPRHQEEMSNFSVQGLPIYYLAALGIGYCTGYFLLIFGTNPTRPQRPLLPFMGLINRLVIGAVWALLLLAPATLVYRNMPQLRVTNGPMFKDYAALVLQDLPASGGVVLSDDARRLALVHAAAARSGKSKEYLFLDTALMLYPDYYRFLKKQNPQRWPGEPANGRRQQFADVDLINWMLTVARSNTVYYLHPSFGYYFEIFYPEPHGLVYKLNYYPSNIVFEVLPSKELIKENEVFWGQVQEAQLKPLLATLTPAAPAESPGLLDRVVRLAHLKREQNRSAVILGTMYSQMLDFWGVELQRSGHLAPAATRFTQAHELNPDNIVAQVNLEANQNLQAGRQTAIQISKSVEDRFGKARNWEQVMNENGPFDDPNLCYAQALVLAHGGNHRQAAREFERVKALAPDNLAARLYLAQLCLRRGEAGRALDEVRDIHAHAEALGLNRTNQTDLLSVEASAELARTNLAGAEATIAAVLNKYPGDERLLAVAAMAYLHYEQYTNAVDMLDQMLKITPDNAAALFDKGYAYLQLGAYEQAIPPLTRVLDMQSTNAFALLHRATAYLGLEKLDAAQQDYEALQKLHPSAPAIYYGLGEIAWRRKDTNSGLRYYQLYLANAPTNNPAFRIDVDFVNGRLKALRHDSP